MNVYEYEKRYVIVTESGITIRKGDISGEGSCPYFINRLIECISSLIYPNMIYEDFSESNSELVIIRLSECEMIINKQFISLRKIDLTTVYPTKEIRGDDIIKLLDRLRI